MTPVFAKPGTMLTPEHDEPPLGSIVATNEGVPFLRDTTEAPDGFNWVAADRGRLVRRTFRDLVSGKPPRLLRVSWYAAGSDAFEVAT